MAPRVTVVNDNPEFLELVRDILEDERYETTCIDGDRDDALAQVVESKPDLLIIDLRMGRDELHGWSIAQEVRREPSLEGLPLILCSADQDALLGLADDLAETKRVKTLLKPFAIDELTAEIERLLTESATA